MAKVLMVAHSFPPYIGGLAYVVENISLKLVERGYEVEVVTLDIEGKLPKTEEYHGVLVKRFKGYAPDGGYFAPSPEFYKYLQRSKADIYHLHNIGALTIPVAYTALRRTGRHYVITPHHHESGYKWHARILWKLYRPYAARIIRNARITHCVSEYEARLVRKDFAPERIVVIPNGVKEDVYNYYWKPPEDRIVLTFAGRIERYKNVDILVEAARILANKTRRKVVVKIIGRGPDLPRIITKARKEGVPVETPGFLPRKKYLEELANTTVFVNPSSYEAYSIVSAEAIAMGVPAVLAKPWGNHFKKYPLTMVVDPSPRTVAEAIYQLLTKTSEVRGLGQARNIPTWSQVVDRLIGEVYERII